MSYRTGDYLAILPLSPDELVQRALTRFDLDYDSHVLLSMERGDTFLPTGTPVAVGELLSSYVELAVPATRTQLGQPADVASDPAHRSELESLAQDRGRHAAEILDKRVSLLDLLESYPSCQLPFTSFLELLTQLTPRRYSISSSPLWSPDHATLTFAVVRAPAWSGRGVFECASSTYLAQARPGSRIAVTVRPSNAAFHPPQSLGVPFIMVCAGTGLAPQVRDTCALIYQEATGASGADAEAWMDEVERTHCRYVADIFT
ncbi:hypothetical protein [Pseudarthrobacter sp. S9]|uniref:hypothetical protein n=1 Tax=Pseudarthrobacter sp. S9 TaxID=3418421 RepID=UPI003CFC6A09